MPSDTDDPGVPALLEQGAALYASGQSAAAARVYRRALSMAPDDPTVRLRLALAIWHGENRTEEALAEVRDLSLRYPQAGVLGAEAMILNSMGQYADAARAARRALAADPVHAEAWVHLATAIPAAEAEAALPGLDRALAAAPAAARRQLLLARARLLKKAGRRDEAFDAMAASNAEAPARWDEGRERAIARQLAATFTPDLVARAGGQGHDDARMVFIVGMPRSGTTLMERLLCAHPAVATVGETPLIGSLFGQLQAQVGRDPAQVAAALTPATLRAMGDAYLLGIATRLREPGAGRVIDKMPANYLFVPLIRLVFPQATIVHMRRHPLDTCLSCWEAGFSFGLDYAARFATLGAAYRLYAATMAGWRDLPGIGLEEVRYERLVEAPEPVMRSVLDGVGLPWDPACLTPAKGGQITTASVGQARQPIGSASVGRWRRHADRLQPLVEALGGTDWIEAQEEG